MKKFIYLISFTLFAPFSWAVHDHEKCEGHDHEKEVAHAGHDHEEEDAHAGHDHEKEEKHLTTEKVDAHAGHDHEEEEGIEISSEMIHKIGLQTRKATQGNIFLSTVFPAEIKLNRDQMALISPRYSSVVKAVFVEVGDSVKKDQKLALLENRTTLSTYSLLAPRAGIVVKRDTAVGEAANENKVLFTVADLSTVWAEINVFPRFQHLLRKGMKVTFIAHDGHTATGAVKYVSPLVSIQTRTFTARCVLKGAAEDFTPGVFVRAQVVLKREKVKVRIEREAVQRIDGELMVFVPTEHGFKSKTVSLGVSDDHFVEITKGLHVGDEYVAKNAFALKAEMVTSGMDSHAGHGH